MCVLDVVLLLMKIGSVPILFCVVSCYYHQRGGDEDVCWLAHKSLNLLTFYPGHSFCLFPPCDVSRTNLLWILVEFISRERRAVYLVPGIY